MLRNQLFVCLHLVFFTACPALLSADETTGYRIWEDRTAQFRVEAAFLKRVENQIQLKRKDNGKVITVPLNRLSGKDRQYLAGLSDHGGSDRGTERDSLSDKTAKTVKSPAAKNSSRQSREKNTRVKNSSLGSASSDRTKEKSEKLFVGRWNNRKYGTSGTLRCLAQVKDGNQWTARFEGTGVYGKFSYDVQIVSRQNGNQYQLQGDSVVSGHRYRWTGQLKRGVLTGNYTATNGNQGSFRLQQAIR
ncbi:MAG: SHD1 domain-containing protein [Planctomycetota bacterium]|nr:SHD1 domain-containing protein [Planctomycetota bacterium]